MTRRHQYQLEIDPAVEAQSKMNKKISMDLVFQSPQLQQLDYKADVILTKMFGVLCDRYIEKNGSDLHLLPATVEAEIAKAPDAAARARLVCDWVASMTDSFAFRTYRRLFDANFGSITDFV
jgi:dGTPase